MKVILSMCILFSMFLLNNATAQKIDIKNIYGIWYRSYEEDKGGIITYRPKGYQFPPARGREKLELLDNGQIVESRVSPSDAYMKVNGRFTYCGKHNELIFSFHDQEENNERTYKIIELDESVLRVQIVASDK